MIELQYTNKVNKLIQNANMIAERNHHKSVQSMDLYLGAAHVKEGTLREMYHLMEPYMKQIENISNIIPADTSDTERIDRFSIPLSTHARKVWNKSIEVMKRYNQTFLNEGHIIKAFYAHLPEHPQLQKELSSMPHERIIRSVTKARDLTVYLLNKDWRYEVDPEFQICPVQAEDEKELLKWVEEHFGESWSKTLIQAFQSSEEFIPIIKAEEKGKFIGFAAFDVYKNKKGIYGPMGVLPHTRHKGVGKGLLYNALHCMQEKGYMYAVLKEAGPIEFYEKECNAKLIPVENDECEIESE
ncbi:GNAT family N-acetyltransferase [Rossellomorea aquimaris]|uniref:GNAT family N-acetyltransferase n=1 Tax=Rossellomorea aquimaris TaxID=189382 RepID=A0A5D4TXA6_9BACI|nr:GNAT family N-acetyltransferase [Rossellomorea aquimaris]TYS75157.1 GNAT family N-acetyltransferase [Rossellomorea aquimaris]TYS79534.1 GNAT family N-acetyltransferase [Rossellomorea aquimaris]